MRRQPCKLFSTTFAKSHLTMLSLNNKPACYLLMVVTSSHQFCRTVLRMRAFDACQQNCATLNSLHVEAASAHEFSAQGIIGETLAGHAQEILQEFQQPFSFIVFRFSFVDLEQ